jgi:hypothetical protein
MTMGSIVFDTLAFVKRMTAAGMPREQAEALAAEHAQIIDERLATKTDLEMLKRGLTIRLGGITVAATGILLAAKFFA